MSSSMVRYKVRPDRADENEALVKAVYEELALKRPDGLRYATFRLPDGVSFNDVAAFTAFVTDIASRCDEPPVATEITLVGSYGVGR